MVDEVHIDIDDEVFVPMGYCDQLHDIQNINHYIMISQNYIILPNDCQRFDKPRQIRIVKLN